MDKLISSFVDIHLKKSYKAYAGFVIKPRQSKKTFYKVFIDLSYFNGSEIKFEDLEKLFCLFKKNQDFILEIFSKNYSINNSIRQYIKSFIISSENLSKYIRKVNENIWDYDKFTQIINSFATEINDNFKEKIKEIKKLRILKTKEVFIGIQFDDDYKEIASVIKQSIKYSSLTPIKIDEIEHNDIINEVLIERMNQSDFGVFEISSLNNNVFFEAGYLSGQGKPIILISKNEINIKIPFDVYAKNRVIYKDFQDLEIKLKKRIDYVMKSFE